jgi:hypothetical protein
MPGLITDVVVLCWSAPASSDRSAHKIATFLGSEPTLVSLNPTALGDIASIRQLVPKCSCLVVDAETLAKAADVMRTGVDGLSGLTTDVAGHVFIYGFLPTERHHAVLRYLSSSRLIGVHQADVSANFRLAESRWCGSFSGLSLRGASPIPENCFLEGPGTEVRDTLIRVGGEPFFIRTSRGGSELFFSASGELADLDQKVSRPVRPLSWFSRLIPLMMFLRGALGDRVWHNDHPRACFIIDDPLLKKRYGFLEYKRLVEAMRREKFSTSIAFIPWNYRRSTPDVAALLSSNQQGGPSLCVHGCDHIDAEFETTDFDSLRGRAQTALERMRAHRRLSGVPFDDVMVFPRGRFSAEAVAALKASGYLATVNGDVWPGNMRHTLTLRDLLEVAVTRFSDFPLFSRRYPRDIAEFAFDLFVGKPVLAVEHHGYFRDGYGALAAFVEQLHALEPRLEWTNLSTICSRACLTRTAPGGEIHVQFYASRFSMQNNGAYAQRYTLVKRCPPDARLPIVTVNGRECGCEREDDRLIISLSLESGQTADIRLVSEGAGGVGTPWRPTNIQNAKVGARRLLGEFRDNYLDTTRGLLGRLVDRSANNPPRVGR